MTQVVKQNKRKKQILMAMGIIGAASVATLAQTAHADAQTQTAEGFDLTKQATTSPFPVMFDRFKPLCISSQSGSRIGTSKHQ